MKMSSRDDETLPLSGFSEGFSTDVTVDEDFIPTSQPRSSPSSKVSRSVESNSIDSSVNTGEEENTQVLSGFVDDTLPPEAVIQETQDKSVDFIPDTDTKRRKIYSSDTVTCRKKLPVFEAGDVLDLLLEEQKMNENSTVKLQTNSACCDSLMKMESSNIKMGEGSITEVNDSAETVELGNTPLKVAKLQSVGNLKTCENFSPGGCEETQLFDNSALLLDQPGPSGLNEVNSQKLYLNETVDDEMQIGGEDNLEVLRGQVAEDSGRQNEETFLKEEPHLDSTLQDGDGDSPSVIIKRKIEFKLNISCLVTINAATKKVVQKAILNVDERPKLKTPPFYSEFPNDCASDKSKRCSTSSSGSVYSDKNSLPFALPKRVSTAFDQTGASDSSEESWTKLIKNEKKYLERVPWSNECLLALKMDEIMKGMIENQDLMNRPSLQSPKKQKRSIHRGDINHLAHISENSVSVHTSKSETDLSQSEKLENDSSDVAKDSTPSLPEVVLPQEQRVQDIETDSNAVENLEANIGQEKDNNTEIEQRQQTTITFCDGLRVFARWTDKQYYSGVLSGQSKNDKWDVLFDDGKLKSIKVDFIIPAAWLKVGSLVFAFVDDNYESGQVAEMKQDKDITYVIQLDNEEQKVKVGLSDMCLSDDMVSILRENYQPMSAESPQRKADITFDNVLSGKRLREYRTPLRSQLTGQSSGSKKKPTSKSKDLETLKETPRKRKSDRRVGQKSEIRNLVEETSDSPTEGDETPLRNTAKEARGKAKPRSLTYELEERLKKKQRQMIVDNMAIPGPSGVKFKRKKTDESATSILLESSLEKSELESSVNSERKKRKRKAAELRKEESPKKLIRKRK